MYPIILSFIALGSLLVWYLLHHDHGRNLPVASLWLAFGFGVIAVVAAWFIEVKLFPRDLILSSSNIPLGEKLLLFLGIGGVEEGCKFVPLALFIYHRNYFKEHTDGVIYFAICGLTFGLFENILYTINFGAKVGLTRLVLTPFMHAATTSILGYYLISMKLDHHRTRNFILACIMLPLMHGMYDFGLSSGIQQLAVLSLMITLLLTLGLFLYFMEANTLDRAQLATVPITTTQFCPQCGHSLVSPSLFCQSCGYKL